MTLLEKLADLEKRARFYSNFPPVEALKLLAALKEAREALENINREAVLVPPGTSPLIVTYLATFAERARQAIARMEERLR